MLGKEYVEKFGSMTLENCMSLCVKTKIEYSKKYSGDPVSFSCWVCGVYVARKHSDDTYEIWTTGKQQLDYHRYTTKYGALRSICLLNALHEYLSINYTGNLDSSKGIGATYTQAVITKLYFLWGRE